MKTSIIVIAALILNTTLLLAEPLATMLDGINPWVFVTIESILLVVFFLNSWVKKLNEACKMDFGYLKVFVVSPPNK